MKQFLTAVLALMVLISCVSCSLEGDIGVGTPRGETSVSSQDSSGEPRVWVPTETITGDRFMMALDWETPRAEAEEYFSERGRIFANDTGILFESNTIADTNVYIIDYYHFTGDKLSGAANIVSNSGVDFSFYLDTYDLLREIGNSQWGEPVEDNEIWVDESAWGDETSDAIATGKLAYFTLWDTPTGIAELHLFGEDRVLVIAIMQGDANFSAQEVLNGAFYTMLQAVDNGNASLEHDKNVAPTIPWRG